MDCDKSLPKDEMIPDVPMILNPEIRDIFPIFVKMLDIKSFMKLAMASKGMYKRCMEDKAIRLSVNEKIVHCNDPNKFIFTSSIVSEKLTRSYLSTIKQMRCTINLRALDMRNNKITSYMTDSTRLYLTTIGVRRIEKLFINKKFSEWDAIILFIKDFHVNILAIGDLNASLPLPVLRTLLQLNLKEFSYTKSVPVDLLFEVNTSIPRLSFIGINNIPKDKFTQILWMIQTGSLTHMTVNINAVDWSSYDKLPFDHEGPIPDDRPLLFERKTFYRRTEYYFLHWQGGVTKCVSNSNSRTLEVFKCKPDDLPPVLRKDEDVMKDLTQMRSGVSCYRQHFSTFSDSFTMFDLSLKGPLPIERPLYFKASETSFWRLNKHDSFMECAWENSSVIWRHFMPRGCMPFAHPALVKYLFWKLLEKKSDSPFVLVCESQEVFESWFEDYETLNYDYTGRLLKRPLVFGGQNPQTRYVLFDDVWFESFFTDKKVHVKQYHKWRRFTYITLKEILQSTSSCCGDAYVNVRVSLKTFRRGLTQFESNKPDYVPVIWKSMRQIDGVLTEECWYCIHGAIRKVVWSEGRMVKSPGHLGDSPVEFMKMIFKEFPSKVRSEFNMLLELKQFESYLEQFTVVPYDYSGPLTINLPLAFVKKEVCHACNDDLHCQCSDLVIHVWFLWEDLKSTGCSWGAEEPKKIVVKTFADHRKNMPLVLKSREHLKTLLEASYDRGTQYDWFGDINDFLAFFDDFKKLPFDYKGDLPRERPLVFEDGSDARELVRFYLREDNSVVKCEWILLFGAEAHLCLHQRRGFAPPVTWKFL